VSLGTRHPKLEPCPNRIIFTPDKKCCETSVIIYNDQGIATEWYYENDPSLHECWVTPVSSINKLKKRKKGES